jgi:hypothetical protein
VNSPHDNRNAGAKSKRKNEFLDNGRAESLSDETDGEKQNNIDKLQSGLKSVRNDNKLILVYCIVKYFVYYFNSDCETDERDGI